MRKFTAFTVILTILVVVVVSDIVANDYMSQENIEASVVDPNYIASNVLGSDVLGSDASFDLNSGSDDLLNDGNILANENVNALLNDGGENAGVANENSNSEGVAVNNVSNDNGLSEWEAVNYDDFSESNGRLGFDDSMEFDPIFSEDSLSGIAGDQGNSNDSLTLLEALGSSNTPNSNDSVNSDSNGLRASNSENSDASSLFNSDADFESSNSVNDILSPDYSSDSIADFEDSDSSNKNTNNYAPNVYLREEQLISAGFVNAYLEDTDFDGSLFKTINLSDIPGLELKQTLIRSEYEMLAKVYIFKPSINFEVSELYELLKARADEGLNLESNVTDEFGQNSFYMNDVSRPNVAFLTVRIGGLIYAFSYPKTYHSQIKNLIQLIEWEF